MNPRYLRSVLIGIAVLAYASAAHAAPVGTAFSYQGQLKQNGAPANGNLDMEFQLFDAATLGNQIGNPVTLIGVPVSNGLFTVTLNAAGQFGPSAFNGEERWLAIAVGGTPLTLRQRLTAAPYALHALDAPDGHSLDAADGNPIDALYVNNDGNVGIGTGSPTQMLDVAGNVKASGTITSGNSITIDGTTNTITSTSGAITFDDADLTTAGLVESTAAGFKFPDGSVQSKAAASAVVYTRWGRTSCPAGSELVYEGIVGGAHYSHSGGGVSTVCLSKNPTWDGFNDTDQNGNLLYGAEYETGASGISSFTGLHDFNAPCAVCLRTGRAAVIMVPGTQVCPGTWSLEYAGYLMSNQYQLSKSDTVCVDRQAEPIAATNANQNGTLWYSTEAECGSLPCPPYVQNREVTCSVCSRP